MRFLSPCIAEKDEIDDPITHGNVNYNVTFKHLIERLKGIDISAYSADCDLKATGLGDIYTMSGGFKESLELFLEKTDMVMNMDGVLQKFDKLVQVSRETRKRGKHPLIIDVLSCDFGCVSGAAVKNGHYDMVDTMMACSRIRSQKYSDSFDDKLTAAERRKQFEETYSMLDPHDFSRTFTERYRQPYTIPEETYEEIFKSMYKLTPESRAVNCHSCGYNNCREMALAIALGYNRKENCVHYSRDEKMRLYMTDSLTGIPRFVPFCHETKKMIHSNQQISYMMCAFDINNFRVVNELYGFDMGDKVICGIANMIKALVDETGGTYCRDGLDFFVFCIPHSNENIEKILKAEKETITSFAISYPISINYGFCVIDDLDIPVNSYIDRSRAAQNQVKYSNSVKYAFFTKTLLNTMLTEANVTEKMNDALLNHEFKVYLQPQYYHPTGKLIGAESLCRWVKKDNTVVSPGQFIPIFEKMVLLQNLTSICGNSASLFCVNGSTGDGSLSQFQPIFHESAC